MSKMRPSHLFDYTDNMTVFKSISDSSEIRMYLSPLTGLFSPGEYIWVILSESFNACLEDHMDTAIKEGKLIKTSRGSMLT